MLHGRGIAWTTAWTLGLADIVMTFKGGALSAAVHGCADTFTVIAFLWALLARYGTPRRAGRRVVTDDELSRMEAAMVRGIAAAHRAKEGPHQERQLRSV